VSNYIFENAAQPASQRFSSLETLYDHWTIRHLEATGIGPGWHCWEVGAGGESIGAWLAQRSGKSGHVLITDIDPRFLAARTTLDQPTIEIQRHDSIADPMPAQTFDLIHAGLVLVHVAAREQTLQRMVAALKPGGWLVIDDFDITLLDRRYPTTNAATSALVQKMDAAQDRLMTARGVDLRWGRSLYRRLQAHGLVDVNMEGSVAVWEGKSPGVRLDRANFEYIRQEAVNAGFLTHEEIDQVLAQVDDPAFAISAPVMFTAWGRRPSSVSAA
jgi:ubiquinone/menaquinone biosynthesis C-methylase UbiE